MGHKLPAINLFLQFDYVIEDFEEKTTLNNRLDLLQFLPLSNFQCGGGGSWLGSQGGGEDLSTSSKLRLAKANAGRPRSTQLKIPIRQYTA